MYGSTSAYGRSPTTAFLESAQIRAWKDVPVIIKCISQQILLSGLGGRKAPSSMGKVSTAEVPSATLGTGSSTPRHKRCVTRQIGGALRSEAVTFLISVRFWWPESYEEHRLTSIVGVLRLRAINPLLSSRSARRFAQ